MRLNNPLSTPIRSPLHGLFTDIQRFPDGAILHYDADIDAFSELTGGPHTFNHAVLSPQYQRNADGSYTDVGARPAVDTFDGERWLRSCGAVTNLFSAGSEDFSNIERWSSLGMSAVSSESDAYKIVVDSSTSRHMLYPPLMTFIEGDVTVSILAKKSEYRYFCINIKSLSGANPRCAVVFDLQDGVVTRVEKNAAAISTSNSILAVDDFYLCTVTTNINATTGYVELSPSPVAIPSFSEGSPLFLGDGTSGILVRNPILTATPYPVPYVPPGVTQPASNATTTNGMWFSLPDGSPLWKALTGEPLTLATRVRMGVGSADLPVHEKFNTFAEKAHGTILYGGDWSGTPRIAQSHDGVNSAPIYSSWDRYSVVRYIVQVSAAGTQFRVGYMIEGTHTTIQWSVWVEYDGSFDPSTLYRFMLGYSNPYPMWFNKITAWKEQVSDDSILAAMS